MDNKLNYNNQDGFIALMSVIIISAILIVLVVIISTSSFFTRFNVLDYENKKVSNFLAEACVENALVNLAKDPSYHPTDTINGDKVTVDLASANKTCRICQISGSGTFVDPYAIKTRAVYSNAYTYFAVKAESAPGNLKIDSWDEQTSYSGSCAVP